MAKAAKKNQAFTILIAPTTHPFGRILMMVPKKYGNAPERNTLRRRLKTIFVENKLYEHKMELVVITRPTAKNYDFLQLSKLLLEIFKKN